MKIEQLTRKQIETICKTNLRQDFPANERRPLPLILKAVDDGRYLAYALMQDGHILSYAFFAKLENACLLDYLATDEAYRSRGLGGDFLCALRERLSDFDCIIAEVEDPAFAPDADSAQLQTRRLRFYERNGFSDTGVRVNTFGVDFILIEMLLGEPHSQELIRAQYQALYRAVLPEALFSKHIRVKD
ncbi:MAG: hypothetical protein MJ118_03225 [Clostridia bacterium]|nr:hypothetical protein [Clostridia bacterium]